MVTRHLRVPNLTAFWRMSRTQFEEIGAAYEAIEVHGRAAHRASWKQKCGADGKDVSKVRHQRYR